jgi:hypothetical protein
MIFFTILFWDSFGHKRCKTAFWIQYFFPHSTLLLWPQTNIWSLILAPEDSGSSFPLSHRFCFAPGLVSTTTVFCVRKSLISPQTPTYIHSQTKTNKISAENVKKKKGAFIGASHPVILNSQEFPFLHLGALNCCNWAIFYYHGEHSDATDFRHKIFWTSQTQSLKPTIFELEILLNS